MDTFQRRIEIEKRLLNANIYLSGTMLAEEFNVSRQVIVQDIAILRAKGIQIIATPQGYIIQKAEISGIKKVIKSSHHTLDELKEELEIIIDNGGSVLDVIVEHDVYGEIKVDLNLTSRKEIISFIQSLTASVSRPLSTVTNGIHFHTVEVKNEQDFIDIINELSKKKYLKIEL